MFLICSSHKPICLLTVCLPQSTKTNVSSVNINLPCSLTAYPSCLKCYLAWVKNQGITAKIKTEMLFRCKCLSFSVLHILTNNVFSSILHYIHFSPHYIHFCLKNYEDFQTLPLLIQGRSIYTEPSWFSFNMSENSHSKMPLS